ncbi:hypothetical protein PsorP6_011903 [Peronosclerospora sorghi]|uniref:Uncharacterized protein n=1 Tax=Peronosclerospora sorghi TaxID=230839 RepID=A0ACC0WLU2_9STRA|nr:hypothetical protein PsorP6_011903 [Peronosclerospora sorghi]
MSSRRRTKRKNLKKRRKRRLFAALAAEIRASVDAQWTREKEELEEMRNEEERQRTHERWKRAVEKAAAVFNKQKKLVARRQERSLVLRQVRKETWLHCQFDLSPSFLNSKYKGQIKNSWDVLLRRTAEITVRENSSLATDHRAISAYRVFRFGQGVLFGVLQH